MVDFNFTPIASAGVVPQKELQPVNGVSPYVPAGPINPSTWRFYTLDTSRSTMTGLGVCHGINATALLETALRTVL